LLPSTAALRHRIGVDPSATKTADVTTPVGKRLTSPDGRVVWDATNADQPYVMVNTPATRAVWGLLSGGRFDLGGVRIAVGPNERDYAVVVLTSMDGQPVESSQRLLLAAVGSAQNRNMQWNEDRTSVGRNWGEGPAMVNGIAAQIQLPGAVRAVHALDGRGHRQGDVAVSNGNRFSIGSAQRTLWYEIVRP
jgi:hypothetical protein